MGFFVGDLKTMALFVGFAPPEVCVEDEPGGIYGAEASRKHGVQVLAETHYSDERVYKLTHHHIQINTLWLLDQNTILLYVTFVNVQVGNLIRKCDERSSDIFQRAIYFR